MSTREAHQSHETTASTDSEDDRPRGRLLRTPAGRAAEVVDVIDTKRGPRFRAIVLDLGREITIVPEQTTWIDGGRA